MNRTGTIIEEMNFDAWGNRRNPINWSYTNVPEDYIFDRGFTLHEYLKEFKLINMNGRVYDPVIARFLSPDPYVQAPDYSQSYNRYSYVMNNPLKFTDPTGNKWWHWLIADVLTGGAFSSTGIAFGSPVVATLNVQTASAMLTTSVTSAIYDLGHNGKFTKMTNNAFAIDLGMMNNIPGMETPQAIAGNYIAHYRNLNGEVTNVENGIGYDLVNGDGPRQGITLGSYINGRGIREDYKNDPLFVHEFGHTVQSKLLGPMYLHSVGFPSGLSGIFDYEIKTINHDHNRTWFEINANQYGQLFFLPEYLPIESPSDYSTNFNNIEWKWFFLYNPLILL